MLYVLDKNILKYLKMIRTMLHWIVKLEFLLLFFQLMYQLKNFCLGQKYQCVVEIWANPTNSQCYKCVS